MWPYFALVALIILLQIRINSRMVKIQFYIGIIALFIFAACRGNDNGDYFAYLNYGWDIRTWSDVLYTHQAMEIGYRMIAFVINWIGLPRQAIIMAMNFISLSCIFAFIRRYSENWCLSLLVFLPLFFQFDMHAARTAVAISISALCMGYALDKKLMKFIVTMLFAMMFHSAAIIVLPLYLLPYIKFDILFGVFLIVFDMLFVKIIGFDRIAIGLLELLGLNRFRDRYLEYSVVKADRYGYKFSLADPRLLILIVIFVIAVITIKNRGKMENMLINCCLANILLLILFSEHTALACRLSAFYNVYVIVLIPSIMESLSERFRCYKSTYVGSINILLSKIGYITFFSLFACVYIYVCFIVPGVDYRLFFS